MKKIEVKPEKVRGMGNLIPPLSVSDFELSDCMIHEEDPFKINGHLFNHFSIDVPVVPVNLVLSTNVATIYPDATTPNTAVITATLTDSSGAPVSNVDVYFQEEGVRIGTASTNAQGACTFEYSNSSGGTHTIRAYTMKQGKYNKSSAEINLNVYMPTSLSLSPVSTIANSVDTVTLSSKIIDQNDLPLAGKLIDLYHGDLKIKSAYSNSKGIVEFPIRVTDLGKTNTVLTCTVDKTSVTVGETVTLTATVKSDGVNVNEGQVDFGDGVLVDVSNGTAVKTFTKTTPTVLTVTPSYKGTSVYTSATASSLTITWIEELVTPEITISADTLIGEVGDDLPITLSSNLKNTALTILLNDAEIVDSVTTDNTGNTSFNYNCTGAGDVSVKVKYIKGTNVYYSNILNLEDCFIYGFKGDETFTNHSNRTGTINVSYSDTYELIFQPSTGVFALMDKDWIAEDGSWCAEFDMKATGFDGGRIGIKRKNGTDSDRSCVGLKPQTNRLYANLSPSETVSSNNIDLGGYSSYKHYKIIANQGKTYLYQEDNLKSTIDDNDWLNMTNCLFLHGWTTGQKIYVKNFKVKKI